MNCLGDGTIIALVDVGPRAVRADRARVGCILEQMDGVRLTALERTNRLDVWRSAPAMFETARAIRAGRGGGPTM